MNDDREPGLVPDRKPFPGHQSIVIDSDGSRPPPKRKWDVPAPPPAPDPGRGTPGRGNEAQ